MLGKKSSVTFHAQDFDESLVFYKDLLGLEYLHGWDRADGRGAIFKLSESSELEFFGPPRGQAQSHVPPKDIDLGILVEDVDTVYAQLKDKLSLVYEIESHPWGNRSFGFRDPNGLKIYCFQRINSALAD
jgi:catechol 2,3-dioxygenase-like lactoylglutathione lyase family enzyme